MFIRELAQQTGVPAKTIRYGEHCVCYLLKTYRESGWVIIQ